MRNRIHQLLANNASSKTPVRMETGGDAAELFIYDVIDQWWGISASSVQKEMAKLNGQPLNVHINSPGGDVFEGRAIANLIKSYKGKTTAIVDALAASSASTIALAANDVQMSQGSFLMIHRSWTFSMDNCNGLREMADLLEKIDGEIAKDYAAKAGVNQEEALAWMDAETWFTADEAVAAKLANSVRDAQAVSNKFNLSAFDKTPKSLLESKTSDEETMQRLRARASLRARLYETA